MKIRRGHLTATLAVLLLMNGSQSASAEAIVRKSVSYFYIGGHTAEDLDRELQRSGPYTNSTGSRHPGATRIKFDGDLSYVKRNGACAIGDVKVIVKTQLVLPRWKYRRQAPQDLALIWDALSSDIERHEARHAEIAKQHARSLDAALRKLRPMSDCRSLQAKVAEVSDKALAAHDADQLRFDRIEAVNFERRLARILQTRIGQSRSAK